MLVKGGNVVRLVTADVPGCKPISGCACSVDGPVGPGRTMPTSSCVFLAQFYGLDQVCDCSALSHAEQGIRSLIVSQPYLNCSQPL